MNYRFLASPVLLGAIVLSGCATVVGVQSDDLKANGLLIGQIDSANSVLSSGWADGAKLMIDGREYRGVVSGDQLLLALPPGQHTLESLVTISSAPVANLQGPTVSGQLREQVTRTYPIKKSFVVEAGRAHNLGFIALFFPESGSNRFHTVYADNRVEMDDYLRYRRPDLYTALGNPSLIPLTTTFMTEQQLQAVRQASAAQAVKAYRGRGGWYYGSLGKVAWMFTDKSGKPQAQLVDPGTVQMILDCDSDRSRIACIYAGNRGGRVFLAQGEQRRTSMPAQGYHPATLHLSSTAEITLVDRHMDVYFSKDNGQSWSSAPQARLAKPLERGDQVRFYPGKTGQYVYSTGKDGSLLYRPYDRAQFARVETPKHKGIAQVLEDAKGLYIGPEFSYFSDSRMFFRAAGAQQWVERKLPGSTCSSLKLDGPKLVVQCGLAADPSQVSYDQGATWSKE